MSGKKTTAPERLECRRMVTSDKGIKHECRKPAEAVTVIGEIAEMREVLCPACVTAVRNAGWKVKYALKSDESRIGG